MFPTVKDILINAQIHILYDIS